MKKFINNSFMAMAMVFGVTASAYGADAAQQKAKTDMQAKLATVTFQVGTVEQRAETLAGIKTAVDEFMGSTDNHYQVPFNAGLDELFSYLNKQNFGSASLDEATLFINNIFSYLQTKVDKICSGMPQQQKNIGFLTNLRQQKTILLTSITVENAVAAAATTSQGTSMLAKLSGVGLFALDTAKEVVKYGLPLLVALVAIELGTHGMEPVIQ